MDAYNHNAGSEAAPKHSSNYLEHRVLRMQVRTGRGNYASELIGAYPTDFLTRS